MGLLNWLSRNDPQDAVELEQDEQFWAGHGKRRRAPNGKSLKVGAGRCHNRASRWEKCENTALDRDELDEALKESGWGG